MMNQDLQVKNRILVRTSHRGSYNSCLLPVKKLSFVKRHSEMSVEVCVYKFECRSKRAILFELKNPDKQQGCCYQSMDHDRHRFILPPTNIYTTPILIAETQCW